ncbi:proline-rich protein PRCC [Ornithorhynchus anatinus]|uniref:Proline rich mitotic checkpoint control factor n=1 Tax=Ornithorhynchus anatinus TaxID=9258 RepID=A0A6I8N6G1_ORNAN|nr:proline-rich protein PRCC [Ornithorhynchus anatinus]
MSLVAYASSEESDADEAEPGPVEEEDDDDDDDDEAAPGPGAPPGGLFASLPPPKGPSPGPAPPPSPPPLAPAFPALLLPPPPPGPGPARTPPPPFGPPAFPTPGPPPPPLPHPRAPAPGPAPGPARPRKRTEPVRIAAPELTRADSDSEEDEPKKKASLQGSAGGTGLSALLPQPRNLTVKEPGRALLPHAFSRKPPDGPPASRPPSKAAARAPPSAGPIPSPSAIKAAAKSAALQVAKQMAQDGGDSDGEDLAPENYFSLPDRVEPPPSSAAAPTPAPPAPAAPYLPYVPDALAAAAEDPPPGTEPEPDFQGGAADAPLEFKTADGWRGAPWVPRAGEEGGGGAGQASGGPFPPYGQPGVAGAYYQDYYGSGYYPDPDPAVGAPQDLTPDASFMDDEAFKRLQGKRNRGREEINFVEIKGDDQLSGTQHWLAKSLTEEKTMKSFSKKKGEQPTGQQRRKHQITYLIHQAKERELELKNSWSENKLSRRQTQAKYGF